MNTWAITTFSPFQIIPPTSLTVGFTQIETVTSRVNVNFVFLGAFNGTVSLVYTCNGDHEHRRDNSCDQCSRKFIQKYSRFFYFEKPL